MLLCSHILSFFFENHVAHWLTHSLTYLSTFINFFVVAQEMISNAGAKFMHPTGQMVSRTLKRLSPPFFFYILLVCRQQSVLEPLHHKSPMDL